MDLTTWILTDGKAGHLNQCLGLAEALGVAPVIHTLVPAFPWTALPPGLWPAPLSAGATGPERLAPPWPELLISAGRCTVAPAAAIRRAAGPATFAVQIQDPGAKRDAFDLIVAPTHDRLSGANVFETAGALTRITPAALAAAADAFAPLLSALPRPLVAVLIGGSNGPYRMTEAATHALAAQLHALCEGGAGLAVTASRRTGRENTAILREALASDPVYFWDGTGDNPYLGFLALADAIVVTADSVSMVSEAGTTGKPVLIAAIEGGSKKFARFHAGLRDRGVTRPFSGTLEVWDYAPLDDTARAADEVCRRLAAR